MGSRGNQGYTDALSKRTIQSMSIAIVIAAVALFEVAAVKFGSDSRDPGAPNPAGEWPGRTRSL